MNMINSFLKFFCLFWLKIFLFTILVGTLFYKAEFCMVKYGDIPVVIKQNIRFLISGLIITGFFYFFLLSFLNKHFLNNLLKGRWWLYFLILILQFLVIFYFRINLTADWEALYLIAQRIISGDFSSLNRGGYLYAYPHNLGVTFYFIVLNILSKNNLYLPRIFNILYSAVIFFLINKTFTLLNPGNKKYENQFFVFSLLFIPPIFMVNMVYNEILSTMLFLAGAYFCIKFVSTRQARFLFLVSFLFSLGNFIRSLGFLFWQLSSYIFV